MGLDMFLEKRSSKGDWQGVAYWRKANQIRNWFNEKVGVENCQYTPVTKELLQELVCDCKMVVEHPELASKILPTRSGFFFGSTEYDEWYFDDLHETIVKVTEIIETTDWENEEVAYYEWW